MSFVLDPFQQRAIDAISENSSVFVAAPTGAGKTRIAEAVVDKAMAEGKGVIYTAPIKALSNQKFRDFRAVYGEKVGILTGDVSLNPDAPIVIMTTEIYRNSLFESAKRVENVGWVIFDEIHYLDDPDRGTVWEEALLFTPDHIQILSLSATVPNVHELADWIRSIHDRPMKIIEESHRPVPLEFFYLCQGKIMSNSRDLKNQGYFNRPNWKLTYKEKRRGIRMPRSRPNRLEDILTHLKGKDKLPCIFFAFGRRRVESLAVDAYPFNFLTKEERADITKQFDDLLEHYDIKNERSSEDMRPLIEHGIAYHHAGMLPTLKEVVEQLFTSKKIKLIFTTETFALGINMPARSVVFDDLEKFYGKGFRPLTTRDFYQMAGRAGRRGMDTKGFVYMRVQPHYLPFTEVQRMVYGKPEAIRSQWNTTYATVLNLYRDMGQELFSIYPKSFHYFQSPKKKQDKALGLFKRKLAMLEDMGYIHKNKLTQKGEIASSLFGYELVLSEMNEEGALEPMSEVELAILMAALIFEPRKGDRAGHLGIMSDTLRKKAEHYHRIIHRKEAKFKIVPYTKPLHFHLSKAIRAWTEGDDFEQLFRLTSVDEGELVRYFRMVIQLLRELSFAPHVSETLKEKAREARRLINRGVVDAEKQLRS